MGIIWQILGMFVFALALWVLALVLPSLEEALDVGIVTLALWALPLVLAVWALRRVAHVRREAASEGAVEHLYRRVEALESRLRELRKEMKALWGSRQPVVAPEVEKLPEVEKPVVAADP
ncbi:MAG: hypothetical protein ACE5JI_07950, partial [Acidobacteriota bacterium]